MLADELRPLIRHDVLIWRSLDADESIQTEYTLLRYPEQEIAEATMDKRFGPESESDDCLPAGEYRFEESFTSKFVTDATWEELTWGFTLAIEE